MRRFEVRVVGGILLIAAGALFLLQNLGVLVVSAYLWPLLFGAGGVIFLYVFLANRAHWWAVIPGFVLLSLAVLMALDRLAPQIGETWGGTLFLGGIGLGFWAVYFANREQWWAVIPGGVLLTIGLVAGLSSSLEGIEIGRFFFLGLGLTFGLLSFLPTPEGRMKWALIPAVVLLAIGLLITTAATAVLNYLGPAALILAGLYLIIRTFGSRPSR
ncbi:MAG TPA: hypothetical protein ENI37_07210 [Chloroflexi bacterium]|nr:hypothetical protein [Chloroflexota bacterium]